MSQLRPCRQWKTPSSFTKEHVIQSSLTKGFDRNNLTLLLLVCGKCNLEFGQRIDRAIGQSGAHGLLRFDHAMKPVEEFNDFRDYDSIHFVDSGIPAYHGARARHVIEDGLRSFDHVPQVALGRLDGTFVHIAHDHLEQIEEPVKDPLFNGDICILGDDSSFKDAVHRHLSTLGLSIVDGDKFLPPTSDNVFSQFTLREEEQRAIAKIAFNYFALTTQHSAPHLIFFDWFDEIREFIVSGSLMSRRMKVGAVQFAAIPFVGDCRLPECHFVGIDAVKMHGYDDRYYLAAVISLFQRAVYTVFLSWNYRGPRSIRSAHYWDLESRRTELLETPELQGLIKYARERAALDHSLPI